MNFFNFVSLHKMSIVFLCKKSYVLSTTLFHTFLRIESKIFQFCSFAQMNRKNFVVIAKGIVEGVISDLFPLYYIAGENGFKFEYFNTFFKPFTICRKNRVLAAHFLKGLCIFTSLL